MADSLILEFVSISNGSVALRCNDRAYRKKREQKTCHYYVCKNRKYLASKSLCADAGVLREPLEVVNRGKDHAVEFIPKEDDYWVLNTLLQSVQAQIDAQPRVPIQQIYEIERGKIQKNHVYTNQDYKRILNGLKKRRRQNKRMQALRCCHRSSVLGKNMLTVRVR